ncbi:MAG: arginine--tRNA ligase, partial [Verrucomicrobiota bacterium]
MTLAAQLEARLLAALPTLPTQKARVQPTADLRFGHYQTNVAMILAKDQRANPRQLAAEIIANLQVDDLS